MECRGSTVRCTRSHLLAALLYLASSRVSFPVNRNGRPFACFPRARRLTGSQLRSAAVTGHQTKAGWFISNNTSRGCGRQLCSRSRLEIGRKEGLPKQNHFQFVSINLKVERAFVSAPVLVIKIFQIRDAHSDILPRFFSVAGASVPRVQQLVTKPERERKKGI